jgi:hypothetical protein
MRVYYLPNLTAHVYYFPNVSALEYYFPNSIAQAHYHTPHSLVLPTIAMCLYQFAVSLLAVIPRLYPLPAARLASSCTKTNEEGGGLRILRVSDKWGIPYNAVSITEIVSI